MILSLKNSSMEHFKTTELLTVGKLGGYSSILRLTGQSNLWKATAEAGKCLPKFQSLLHVYFYPSELSLFTIKLRENILFLIKLSWWYFKQVY